MKGYTSQISDIETGIYVVCSDRVLLNTINTMLRRKGIIGVADAEGKMHYLVDARRNPAYAARAINNLVFNEIEEDDQGEGPLGDQILPQTVKAVIDEVMLSYGFDLTLLGSKAMAIVIRKLALRDQTERLSTKQLFSIAAESLDVKYIHVERNIRYAIKKSGNDIDGIKSMTIIRELATQVRRRLERIIGRK